MYIIARKCCAQAGVLTHPVRMGTSGESQLNSPPSTSMASAVSTHTNNHVHTQHHTCAHVIRYVVRVVERPCTLTGVGALHPPAVAWAQLLTLQEATQPLQRHRDLDTQPQVRHTCM